MLEDGRGLDPQGRPRQPHHSGPGRRLELSSQALFGVAHFDRVFISYALSMIPPWREAVVQAFQAVAPSGSLHIVDFGEQSRLPRTFRTALRVACRSSPSIRAKGSSASSSAGCQDGC